MRFQSGISAYTCRLSLALRSQHTVSAILMRRLLPARLYPGRTRVGREFSSLRYPPDMPVLDGVDWYWGATIVRAIRFLGRRRPDVIVLQWWSGTVLHTYLALALVARLLGARVVIEFHEVLDTGEANIPVARTYVRLIARGVTSLADGFVLHSEFDRPDLERSYRIGGRPVAVIPHGPYDQYRPAGDHPATGDVPDDVCRLLFFGTIRPYKGLEDLIRAFNGLSEEQAQGFRLTVVGETWEGWTEPRALIEASPHRDRIEFVNRYVHDEEVASHFARADGVVLPYHRSSASGPLHIAMSHGLPTIVTRVGGLEEAGRDYAGAIFIPARDPDAIAQAMDRVRHLRGRRFDDPHSWEHTVERFGGFLDDLTAKDAA